MRSVAMVEMVETKLTNLEPGQLVQVTTNPTLATMRAHV